jgi:hypothetical protein
MIELAFDGVARPEQLTLHVAEAHDNYDYDNDPLHRTKDHVGRWQDIPDEHLLRCVDGLSHLAEDGLPYYLPAAMRWVLLNFRDTDSRLIDWTIYQLAPNRNDKNLSKRYETRFARFTTRQWRACEAFLCHLLNQDPDGEFIDAKVALEALSEVRSKVERGEQAAAEQPATRPESK